MADILTVTLNPAVDLATSVDRVVAGPKLYCAAPRVDPGGGGVNVARVVHRLGGHVLALVAVGGAMGQRLLALLAAEGVPTHAIEMPDETRHSLAVTDATTGEQFRFSLPGAEVGAQDAARLIAGIADAAPPGGFVVLSGSAPPGMGDAVPAKVQRALAARTDRLVVDTSRAALARVIARPGAPLHVLRVDQHEAAQAAGRPLVTTAEAADFAQALMARGVARMVITGRGAEGSVMATAEGRYFCRTIAVPVRSKIGAGDAFVGALTLSLARAEPPEDALRWGVAAASATVATEGTALCALAETRALYDSCKVERV